MQTQSSGSAQCSMTGGTSGLEISLESVGRPSSCAIHFLNNECLQLLCKHIWYQDLDNILCLQLVSAKSNYIDSAIVQVSTMLVGSPFPYLLALRWSYLVP